MTLVATPEADRVVASLSDHIDQRVAAATITFFEDVIGDVELLRSVSAEPSTIPTEAWSAHCPVCDTMIAEDTDRGDAEHAAELHHCRD